MSLTAVKSCEAAAAAASNAAARALSLPTVRREAAAMAGQAAKDRLTHRVEAADGHRDTATNADGGDAASDAKRQ
jgi:hypothetical protein